MASPMLSVLSVTGVTVETTELRLPSRLEAVAEVAAAVAEFLSRTGLAEDVIFGIDMAVREGIANAVIHGNKLDEKKVVSIRVIRSPDSLEINVRDQGQGFDPETLSDPTKEENILKTSGRGIFFMRNFMDQVEWSVHPDGGTELRLMKKC
ncbi:MAG: ATP-binding protein [Pyrinomonadaceae bacterium]